jgi:hypothetical protein
MRLRWAHVAGLVLLAFVVGAVFVVATSRAPTRAIPITPVANAAPLLIAGPASTAAPLVGPGPAPFPYLADAGRAGMHADGANSDTHPGAGPVGIDPIVRTRRGGGMLGGQCPMQVFNQDGLLTVFCASLLGAQFLLIDPGTLDVLARFTLPARPSTFHALIALDPSIIFSDTSGAYFYLDEQDRIVVADARYRIRRIARERTEAGSWRFVETGTWDLSDVIPHDCPRLFNWSPSGECDKLTAVMPGPEGRIWFVSRNGRVGTVEPESGDTQVILLEGEEIQNGFAVAADGVFIATDHAMYRFEANAEGEPQVGWREAYDRGSERRVGAINQGTGTTPTLLGDDYVVITDNADERINLVVLRRGRDVQGDRVVCRVALFEPNASVAENSPIVWGNSIIVENNSGYVSAVSDDNRYPRGMTRIDLRADGSGCDEVWTSDVSAPSSVAKLSVGSGLVYAYEAMPQDDGETVWYLTALDFETGARAFSVQIGAGRNFDNNWSAISIGPDGAAYVGIFGGLAQVRDGGD